MLDESEEPFETGPLIDQNGQYTRFEILTNEALTAAVPDSVWVNYELVSTQWPTNAGSKTDPTGVPAPSFLANTTLETYIQGQVRQTSSSCMACHNNASDTTGTPSDFTYLLQRAQ